MNRKNILLLFCALVLMSAQYSYGRQSPQKDGASKVITGTITDSKTNEPLAGVTLMFKSERSRGTMTDGEGRFSLAVPNNGTTLVVSYTGYSDQEIVITSSTTNLSLGLKRTNTSNLDEVVVVGYGTQRKGDV